MAATQKQLAGDVKSLSLAPKGKLRIEWANQWMPVLQLIRKRIPEREALKGVRISACLHVTYGDCEPGHHLARWRCGRGALCFQSPEHAR